MTTRRLDVQRRRLLLASSGLFGLQLLPGCNSLPPTKLASDPFSLGVASGEPTADGFVIWTRLAPEPLSGGGMPETAAEVGWEIAADERFERILRRGTAVAEPAWGHSLHVEIDGLAPDRPYWYRFRQNDWHSAIGRARTTPAANAATRSLRFAYVSCQHYEMGYYGAYRHLVADDPELVLHLGDYIYEGRPRSDGVRVHAGGSEARTLAQYRQRYAQYKLDPDLQRAHAHCPWVVISDDHEVENDYAGDQSIGHEPVADFLLRRAAAYQAYWEHMPLRASARPDGPNMALYRQVRYGTLAGFQMLDGRQYRSDQPCGTPQKGGGQVVENCPARLAPEQTMLGPIQERWLLANLDRSSTRWNLIGQQMLMAPLDEKPGPGQAWWTEGWDGYPAARARILQHLASRKIANAVVLGGDIHSFWANDLKLDFDDPAAPVVATEFVGTSVSSTGSPYEAFSAMLPDNPHVRFFESRNRGYVRCTLSQEAMRVDFVGLDDARRADSAARTLASFAVEPGRPGVQRA